MCARDPGASCDLSHPGAPSATVILIRQHQDRLDDLVLADSTLLLSHGDDLTVISDQREDQVARRCREAMDAAPNGTPEHEDARLQFMRTMQDYRNRPGGFWVAAANPDAADEALTGSTPLAGLRSVATLSDGATRLVDRFDLMDWTQLLDVLATQGPSALIQPNSPLQNQGARRPACARPAGDLRPASAGAAGRSKR